MNNLRYSGQRLPVVSSSGAITSGQLVVQEGFFGIALTAVSASGKSLWLAAQGVFNIPVPASTVKGDRLYAADFSNAIPPTLTRTAPTGKVHIGTAVSARDASGNALVLLAAQHTDPLT